MIWYEESIVKGYTKQIQSGSMPTIFPKGKTIIMCPFCKSPLGVLILEIEKPRLHNCPFCEKDFDVVFAEE